MASLIWAHRCNNASDPFKARLTGNLERWIWHKTDNYQELMHFNSSFSFYHDLDTKAEKAGWSEIYNLCVGS